MQKQVTVHSTVENDSGFVLAYDRLPLPAVNPVAAVSDRAQI